jgi:hypothetical protein
MPALSHAVQLLLLLLLNVWLGSTDLPGNTMSSTHRLIAEAPAVHADI